jgi:murein L,D-transpeptidase YcbB/YkuD
MFEFSYGLRWGVWRSTVAALCIWLGSAGAMAQGDCGDLSRAESDLQRAGVPIDGGPVQAFYVSSKGACVWDEISALAMISTIERAGDHGLDPALFHGDELATAEARGWDTEVELLLTDAALKYAEVMTRGLTAPPVPREERAANTRPEGEAIDGLSGALARGDVARWLETLPPKAPAYVRLKAAMSTYRAIAEAGGWETLPTDMQVRFNKKSPLVVDLKHRLAIEGDLARDDEKPVYDEAVRAAVLRFQERNGLRADGKLNPKTIERMNISAAERVAQISLNMERWRVYGRELPATRVEVNAPDATAVLFRNDLPVLDRKSVV